MPNTWISRSSETKSSPNFRLVKQITGNKGVTGIAVGFTVTVAAIYQMPVGFDYIRLHFTNASATTALSINSAIVSVSSSFNDGFTPTNGAWIPVTFNAAGATTDPTYPITTSGNTTSLTIAAASSASVPVHKASDFINVSSVEPTDGSGLYYLMIRALIPTTGDLALAGLASGNYTTYKSIATPTDPRFYYKSVDGVGNPSAFVTPATDQGIISPTAVEFISRSTGSTFLTIGDSITQGYGSSTSINSWGKIAANQVSSSNSIVSFVNNGWAGQVTSDFFANGKTSIDAFKPKVVTIATFSPNNSSTTQSQFDGMWSNAIALAQYARQQGAVPILVTPIPWAYTGSLEGIRQGIIQRVRNYGQNGGLIADFEKVIADPSNPGFPNLSYVGGPSDGHPNDLGNLLMANSIAPALKQAIGV